MIAAADDGLSASLSRLLAAYPLDVAADRPTDVLSKLARYPSINVLVLAETRPHDPSSLDLLASARQLRPDVGTLFLSRAPTLEHATEAMRQGAEDFLPIPFSDEVLEKHVVRILEAADLRDKLAALDRFGSAHRGFENIISRSASMERVFERSAAAARNDTPVLIVGETGTGKELVARAIHTNSRRARRPFVPINCAALPHDLFESELFGHRRGAFSGAHADHAGLFVAADGGTLFLDEISELPADAQPKLLRVLQDGEVRPVGGVEGRKVDVRVIAASNRTADEMSRGLMRQDLFYRLSVIVIDIPPLRKRLDDLPLLVHAIIDRVRRRGVAVDSMEAPALELIARHAFPGNVRELENLVEGVAVMLRPGQRAIGAEDARRWLHRWRAATDESSEIPGLPLRLDALEAWAIREALRRTGGNKRQAAHMLGIARDTLYRKLEELESLSDMSEFRTSTSTH